MQVDRWKHHVIALVFPASACALGLIWYAALASPLSPEITRGVTENGPSETGVLYSSTFPKLVVFGVANITISLLMYRRLKKTLAFRRRIVSIVGVPFLLAGTVATYMCIFIGLFESPPETELYRRLLYVILTLPYYLIYAIWGAILAMPILLPLSLLQMYVLARVAGWSETVKRAARMEP